jgi:predicted dehydrogenase
MSSSAPLRVGIIGCGSIARAHAAALRFLADDGVATVTAAADPDAAGIDRVAEILGDVPHRYGAGADLIDDPEVDAVSVVTPTRFHRDLILATAAAGKPLFAEKPLAPSFGVVRELATAIQAAGIPTQVGFQSRFHPIIRQIRSWITDASFGAPMAYVLRDDQFWPTGAIVDGHTSWRSDRSVAGAARALDPLLRPGVLAVRPGTAGVGGHPPRVRLRRRRRRGGDDRARERRRGQPHLGVQRGKRP